MSELKNEAGELVRKCGKCKCPLLLDKYFKQNRKGDWKKTCEPCLEKRRHYVRSNKARIAKISKRAREAHKDKIALAKRLYRQNNKEKVRNRIKAWHAANKDHTKQWREDYKHIRNERRRERTATDTNYKLTNNLRSRVNAAITERCKSAHTMELIGCTVQELKVKLEAKFEDDMTWNNYGKGWHIDHIRPCASFDLTDPEQQRICFHWSNLQPMWALDNIHKSDTWQAKEDYNQVMACIAARSS